MATARQLGSLERTAANPYALGAAGLAVGLQLVAVFVTPLSMALQVSRPELMDWLVITGFAAIPAMIGQGARAVQVRRGARRDHRQCDHSQ